MSGVSPEIRRITPGEYRLLREFLYQAIYLPQGVEVLDEARFVERTKSGYATHFVITACAPPRLWALRMENGNLFGSWCGRFAPERGGTRLDCVERAQAKRWWMRPLVPWYLRRQQRRYLEDLREKLSEMQPKPR